MAHELSKRLPVRRQAEMPVCYDGVKRDVGYRLGLLVADKVVVELKAAEKFKPYPYGPAFELFKAGKSTSGVFAQF